jgi:hypothetical protein
MTLKDIEQYVQVVEAEDTAGPAAGGRSSLVVEFGMTCLFK